MFVQVLATGSYSSTTATAIVPAGLRPPATMTRPVVSSVAVRLKRSCVSEPAACHEFAAGS